MADDKKMKVDNGRAPFRGASPWAYAVKYQFTRTDRKVLASLPLKGMDLQLQQGKQSLWIVAIWPSGSGVVIRTSFSPEEGLEIEDCHSDGKTFECEALSPAGRYRVRLEVPDSEKSIIHFTVNLTPAGRLSIPFWPSDVYPISENGDPFETRGTVHAAQRGVAMGFVYASLTKPESGTFFYFQNLTALNNLCEQTHTAPDTRVGGSWPELGYTPPIAERAPLRPGKETTLSDGYVAFTPEIPKTTDSLAEFFLDMLADIYLLTPKPEAVYQDWRTVAKATVKDITHADCTTKSDGLRYLSAYVGTGDRRPESMVQLAVLLPFLEYEDWRRRKVPANDELRKTLPSFYDDEIGCIMRYPRNMKEQDGGDKDEKKAYEIDSWYLYHPLVNLARLAGRGDDNARKLLMDSIEYAIRAAHHFDYRWPVLFDGKTFGTLREAPTTEMGETDVAGLYAYLMLRIRDLTGEYRYFEEAKAAVERLKGLHFNTGYQFNNTAWGANALAKLWSETGDETYLHLSYMCLASIFQNAFIWDCNYGHAKYYTTFFGVTPLREGPYIAAYEEMEIYSAFHEYLDLVGSDVPPSVQLLVSEYCKYATDGKICIYPSHLPDEAISQQPQNGQINRKLAIPLEDIYEGWQQAGQVGQEVYGAGLAPAVVVRAFNRISGAPFLLYCQYPMYNLCEDGREGKCTFTVYGDSTLSFIIRLIPLGKKPLVNVSVRISGRSRKLAAKTTPEGHLEYRVLGNVQVELRW